MARLLDNDDNDPAEHHPANIWHQLVKMTDSQMTLQGYQIYVDPETSAARQYLQCWVFRLE